MRRVYRLQKSQYKLDQNKIRAPEYLFEDVYQQMLEYQMANVGSMIEAEPADAGQMRSPRINPTILLVASICVMVIVGSMYFLGTNRLNREPEPIYEDERYPDLIGDYDDTDTYDVFSPEDEEPMEEETEPESDPNLEQETPPDESDESDGRFQIIIRPSLEE